MASESCLWQKVKSIKKASSGFQRLGSRHSLLASLRSLFRQLWLCKIPRAALPTVDSVALPWRSDAYSQATVKSLVMNFHPAGLQSKQLLCPQYLSELCLLADIEAKSWGDTRTPVCHGSALSEGIAQAVTASTRPRSTFSVLSQLLPCLTGQQRQKTVH